MEVSSFSAAILTLLLAVNWAVAAPASSDEQTLSPDVPARRLVQISLFPKAGEFPGETRDSYFRRHNEEVTSLIREIATASPGMKLDRRILTEKVIRRFNPYQMDMLHLILKNRDRMEKAEDENFTPDTFVLLLMDPKQIEMVKRFIERGIDVNAGGAFASYSPKTKSRPLTVAIQYGNLEAVRLLLRAGADPNFANYEYFDVTPLHVAVSQKNLEVVKLLVENGAMINAEAWRDKDGNGLTPTQLAKDKGLPEIEEYLRAKGGTVNYGYVARRAGKQTVGMLIMPFMVVLKLITGSF